MVVIFIVIYHFVRLNRTWTNV